MATLTASDLRDRTRRLLREDVAQLFTDVKLNDFLSEGIRDFSSHVLWYQRVVAVALVANQFEYSLPTDIMKLEMARYQEQYQLRVLDATQWAQVCYRNPLPTGTPPLGAFLSPHDKLLSITHRPTAASAATTVAGALSSSATTIPCASTTSFPTYGRILITTAAATEQVRYFAKDATNFLQCRRGDGDTTAAAHNDLDAIKAGDLELLTRALPPDITGTDIPKFPDRFVHALTKYAAHLGYYHKLLMNEGRVFLADYLTLRDEAARERNTDELALTNGIKDEETEGGYDPW